MFAEKGCNMCGEEKERNRKRRVGNDYAELETECERKKRMGMDGKLAYNFHWDSEVSMELTHKLALIYQHFFQKYYYIFSLLTIHPLVLYLLLWESTTLSKEIRRGYIANQLSHILNEAIFCMLIRVYPLMPYPALHCGGILCGRDIHPQILLTILAIGVILPNPPFEYLLLVMHQKLVLNTTSKVRLSKRSQNGMMLTLLFVLLINIAGFGIFGRRTAKADDILRRLELAWLASKGGEVFLFGEVGDPESFAYECYILGAAIVIIFPPVIFFSIHAVYVISRTKNGFTDHTTRLQVRLTSVLLLQLGSVFKCYALPLGMMITMIMFGTMNMPDWLLGVGRPMLTIEFILNPMPQSLIFLLKNHTYRRIIWSKIRRLFRWITPCIDRTTLSIHTPNAAFSQLPSSSITRPSGVS
ncbi:hypothetical protein PRIPAC_77624 [Pristionchus pacificus]|uniref:G protein-coupled receptor n=1 Tax=Pristionchus pacificus TaxID=54126 RepID=A0A2A6CK60_PRIPA|nr:hypothetical protein PRIPAC_77624 [Pristionchus pacificus]|eukprot:PDM78582.1 G protein-coupled receptor [Pristionchus pacificus]